MPDIFVQKEKKNHTCATVGGGELAVFSGYDAPSIWKSAENSPFANSAIFW